MSLFPAYSLDNNDGSKFEVSESSYTWLKDLDVCLEENEPPQQQSSQSIEREAELQTSSTGVPAAESHPQLQSASSSSHSKKKKRKKEKKKRKKISKKDESSCSDTSEEERKTKKSKAKDSNFSDQSEEKIRKQKSKKKDSHANDLSEDERKKKKSKKKKSRLSALSDEERVGLKEESRKKRENGKGSKDAPKDDSLISHSKLPASHKDLTSRENSPVRASRSPDMIKIPIHFRKSKSDSTSRDGAKSKRSTSRSSSSSRSEEIKCKKMSASNGKCRSLSRSRSKSNIDGKKRESRSRSKSESRYVDSVSKTRSRKTHSSSRSQSKPRYARSSKQHSRSRSRSKKRHSRSRSRSSKRYSRLESKPHDKYSKLRRHYSRSKSRSRRRHSRSESKSRKRYSRSRSTSKKKCSRSQRHSRSGSRSKKRQSRSRSRTKKRHSRSRSRSRRRHSRSRSPSRRRRSRSYSRTRRSKTGAQPQLYNRGRVEEYVSKSKTVFLEGLQGLVKPEQAFFLSTEGDANNNAFTATHFSQLASYKIKARGHIGSTRTRINSSKHKKKALRYFKKAALKILYSDPVKINTLPRNTSEMYENSEQEEYVPLYLTHTEESKVKEPSKSTTVNPLGIYDDATEMYLQGLGDSIQEEPAQTSREIEQIHWQNKSREFNEKLGREPSNVSLWLEFIQFQDDAYHILFQSEISGETITKIKSKKSVKALAERKISILDTAIKKNLRSLKLNFKRLEIGQDIWDDKKLRQEWDTLIFNFPNTMSVWHHYLTFTQTHFTSFNLSSAVKALGRCAERLRQMQSGVFLTATPPHNIGRCLVDVAVQLSRVWRQGGHMERAVALFQALVELNLFPPHHLRDTKMPLEAKLALFEPFWDSRAPRFGEERSVGWAQVMEKKETVVYPEVILEGTHDEEDDLLGSGGSTSEQWIALESSRERRHWLPWEQDPEDCEDPERMVPVDDLSPHLFILHSEEDRYYLILSFLNFLNIPGVNAYMLNCHKKISRTQTERNRIHTEVKRTQTERGDEIFEPLGIETLNETSLFGSVLDFDIEGKRPEILNFDSVGPSLLKSGCEAYYQFLCRVVQQAASVFSQPYQQNLTVLYIKLLGAQYQAMKLEISDDHQLKTLKSEIKKLIKNVLKQEEYRMCLPVYLEYGKVEEVMGYPDGAAKVYSTALAIGTASGNAFDVKNKDLLAILDLYNCYIELQIKRESELCTGVHVNNVVYSLCSLIANGKFAVSNGSPTPGGLLLKAKKKFIELQDMCINSSRLQCESHDEIENKQTLTIKIINFIAMLQLFTVGFKPACLVYENSLEKFTKCNWNPISHKLEDIAIPNNIPLPHKLEDIALPTMCPVLKLEEISLPSETSARNVGPIHKDPKKCKRCHKPEETCQDRCIIVELLYEGYLWLVEVGRKVEHVVVEGVKLSPLDYRSLLSAATEAAPHNNTFLLRAAQNQGWRSVVGVVESVGNDRRRVSTAGLVCQLLPHLHRTLDILTHTQEGSLSCGYRLESVLERTVSSPPGSHCPLLWRLYMALVAVTRPTALKDLAYRALAHCPAVKSVYLDVVRRVPSLLREVVNLMAEKGLRVRLPMEELQVLTEAELEEDKEGAIEEANNEESKDSQ